MVIASAAKIQVEVSPVRFATEKGVLRVTQCTPAIISPPFIMIVPVDALNKSH